MSEYFTVQESIYYTGLSESTIRRIIKKLKKDSQNEQGGRGSQDSQDHIQIIKTQRLRGNEANLIHKSYLDKIRRPNYSQEHSQNNTEHSQDYTQGVQSEQGEHSQESSQNMVAFLMAQLQAKDEQLKEKDEQLKRKDEHINQMLERQRESNLLIGSLQNKALLLEKGKEKPINESPVSPISSPSPVKEEKTKKSKSGKKPVKQTPEPKEEPEKKGGFWSGITNLFK